MGQRSAIVIFLLGGGLLIPAVLVMAFAPLLGRAAIPVAVGVLAIGVGFVVAAQRRASRLRLSEPLDESRQAKVECNVLVRGGFDRVCSVHRASRVSLSLSPRNAA